MYPQIGQTLSEELKHLDFVNSPIPQTLSEELQINENQLITIPQMPYNEFKNPIKNKLEVPGEKLINRLSFSHFTLLLPITDPLKRTFLIDLLPNLIMRNNGFLFDLSGLIMNMIRLMQTRFKIFDMNIKPIKADGDYKDALKRLEVIFDSAIGTSESRNLNKRLNLSPGLLIKDYQLTREKVKLVVE